MHGKKTCNKNNPLGSEQLYTYYKEHRRALRKIIRLAKSKYYSNRFELAAGNIKKTWELINELRGKLKNNLKASFIIDGNLVTDRREIANGFNIFFSSVARKLNLKVQSSRPNPSGINASHMNGNNENLSKYLRHNKNLKNSIFLNPCDKEEIFEIICKLDNSKASDLKKTKCSRKQNVKFRTILTKQTKGQVTQKFFALWMVVTLQTQGLDCRGTGGHVLFAFVSTKTKV